ncbi:uncharacterized protein LOC120202103 isoform X2 [Hibiscus syriacus]|uniref:uncharacterized protein LOC120202103 isoform X2 n=1 Tax=Hibiscus syriacus TaxID=106335 RepID=UPI00192406FD|nr:uncharacterized protein LOC120202103 isoform X2 [Hibiscus syriacus]
MLQIGEENPSRFELLSVVRKHSNLLGKTKADDQDASDVEMDGKFWHDVFDLYFVRGKESRGRQDDDLIFFVRKWKGHGFNDSDESVAPYFVRSQSVLKNHQMGQDTPLSAIYKVVKTVYASPSRVNFHLDSKKEVETTPAYPDICFAIDDFDSTFDAVVLTDTDHCYCVLLNALDGAAFPSEKGTNDNSSSNKSPLRVDTNSVKTKNSKLTLFSGFVSYQMVRDAYDAGSSGFGSLLSIGHSSGKKDRLYMKGPGGRGEVEVVVSGVVDQSKQDSGPFSPIISKKGFGFGSIVRKAASVASVAAKNAYAAAAATSSSDEEIIPLKCCLMSITLPWEDIAYDLLFKGSPPVNL